MKPLWFKAKTYGWGWTPSTWQGWAVTGAFVVVVAACALLLRPSFGSFGPIAFGLGLVGATAILIVICYKTGEKPGWRWGKPPGGDAR